MSWSDKAIGVNPPLTNFYPTSRQTRTLFFGMQPQQKITFKDDDLKLKQAT